MKKKYIAPEAHNVTCLLTDILYEVSIIGGNPDEGEPEAKPMDFDLADDEFFEEEQEKKKTFGLPEKFTNVWDM